MIGFGLSLLLTFSIHNRRLAPRNLLQSSHFHRLSQALLLGGLKPVLAAAPFPGGAGTFQFLEEEDQSMLEEAMLTLPV